MTDDMERLSDWNDAYDSLDNALAYFEDQDCKPDSYQWADLVHSLAAFADGLYGISAIRADYAFTPATERSSLSKPPMDPAHNLTLAQLRELLEKVRLEGVKSRTFRAGRASGARPPRPSAIAN